MKIQASWFKEHYKKWIIFGLLIICILWIVQNYQFVEESSYSLTSKAEHNQFYGSQLLLNYNQPKNDRKTTNLNNVDLIDFLDTLPVIDTDNKKHPTLIIKSMEAELPDTYIKILIDWIKSGGHVVVFTNRNELLRQAELNSDYQKIRTRLKQLQKENADSKTIKNDPLIQKHLNNMIDSNTMNQLLINLGIFYVNTPKNIDVDIERLRNKFQQKNKEYSEKLQEIRKKHKNNETQTDEEKEILLNKEVNSRLRRLLYSNDLFWVQGKDQVLLVDNDHRGGYYDADLFLASQPNSIEKTLISKPVDAEKIRQQLKRFQADYIKQTKEPTDDTYQEKRRQITIKVIDKLLKMTYKDMQLFFANGVYFDAHLEKGRITVLESYELFTNPRVYKKIDILKERSILDSFSANDPSIYQAQNADFLLQLTADSEHIWFLTKTSVVDLFTLLWTKGRLVWFGLGLLVLLWLWSLPNRFGKLQHLHKQQTHDILRYFRQIGRFAWDMDNAQQLMIKSNQQQMQMLMVEHNLSGLLQHSQSQTNTQDWQRLQQLLQTQLTLKQDGLKQFDLSLSEAKQVISNDKLKLLLMGNIDNDVDLSSVEFVERTQTLWLVRWLLHKETSK